MKIKSGLYTSAVLLFLAAPVLCHAQWMTQEIPLVPGWNAVHFEVQPEPRSCAEVFKGLPVQSVWRWDRRFTTIQFTVDPAHLLPESPDWRVWLAPSDPRSFLSRLAELQGSESYLIKVASNAAPFTLQVKGQVALPRHKWFPHGLNLVGLPVNAANPPTFADFFRFTPEVNTTRTYANDLYRLDSQGRGIRIVQPARDRLQAGVAYWVGCGRSPAYQSALHVSPEGASALDFGTQLVRRDLSVRNTLTNGPMTVMLRQRSSGTPPAGGGFAELAGPVPLSYFAKDPSNHWAWASLPVAGLSRTLAPGEEWSLRLGVRRAEFEPHTARGTNGAAYQSYLEITDSAQSLLIRVPVVAQKESQIASVSRSSSGTALLGSGSSQLSDADLEVHDDNEGLWVGQVNVSQVNVPAYDRTNLVSTPAPMSFRLLVHVDGYGNARLLQQVVLAWDPSLVNAPHTNGTYALYSDDRTLAVNATDVNRISSAAFPVMAPILMNHGLTNITAVPDNADGSTNASIVQVASNALACQVTVAFDDPTNPFLHRYHPMHDNQDAQFIPYTNAVESRTIVRDLALLFGSTTNLSASPYYGPDNKSGVYQEALSGLRAQPILMQGVFSLQRISRINQLRGITP